MNMAARNHCSRPIARGLHGHNGCPETSPKALSRLNFQVEDSEKFGLMSSIHYTNAVLTIIALALSVIAVENIVRPSTHYTNAVLTITALVLSVIAVENIGGR